jgi:glyoxylase-like metal-dependent hydrolase (beta-lactamase superfamily II)
MELVDGVYALPLTIEVEDQEMTINPSAVETDRGLLLVDSGWPGGADDIENHLDDHGFDWSDVWGVVLTHQDVDHAGGLAEIAERADPVVFAHEVCAPYVDGRKHPVKLDEDDERYPAAHVDVEISEGDRFNTSVGPMNVVETPGHAPGHISLHLPEEQLLISGDALHCPEGELDGPRYPMDEAEAIDSIEKLAALDIERTNCQHGGYVEHDADRVQEIWTDATE